MLRRVLGKGISSIDIKNDLCVIQFWVVGTGKSDAPVMSLSPRQLAEGHVVGVSLHNIGQGQASSSSFFLLIFRAWLI